MRFAMRLPCFGVYAHAKSQGSRRPQTACGNPGLEAEIPLGLTKKKAKLQRAESAV